jgi:hypothetical protein
MHYLWTIVITLNFVAAALEAYDPDNWWFAYSRIFFFIVQGVKFFKNKIGFSLIKLYFYLI